MPTPQPPSANDGVELPANLMDGSLARTLPEATLVRLTQYLRALNALQSQGQTRTSSGLLATEAGVNPSILRKDLSLLGSYGTRGVGYVVTELAEHISRAMGMSQQWRVAIVGAGNLGRALSGYGGFKSRGFEIVALLDAAPEVIGSKVGELTVANVMDLKSVLEATSANIAVLSVPGAAAQELCDKVVECGVRSILSFAPVVLQVPEGVNLRKVDLATELQILAYHAHNLG